MTFSTNKQQDRSLLSTHARFGRYEGAIVSLLAFLTVFNITDLLTTSVALTKSGLYEGNALLVLIANSLGINLIGAIAVLKMGFISGAIFISILGIRSYDKKTRRLIFGVVGAFAIIFIFASLNNIYWIAKTA